MFRTDLLIESAPRDQWPPRPGNLLGDPVDHDGNSSTGIPRVSARAREDRQCGERLASERCQKDLLGERVSD